MRKTIPLFGAFLLALGPVALAADVEPKNEEEKAIYGLGVASSQSLSPFNLNAHELELFKAGLADGVLKGKTVDMQALIPKLQELQKTRAAATAASEKKAGEAYFNKMAAEKGAQKKPGFLYIETLAGKGESPKPTDNVKVHYVGTLRDGTEFDSSIKRNQPASFPLNGVIKCWTDGLQLMKVGGKGKFVCPSDVAYGDNGRPPQIKPGATLTFEVELLEILKPATPAPATPAPAATEKKK